MKVKIIFIAFFCLMVTGCWNYNELNDLAIVTGMGIDKKDGLYQVSLMIANSQAPSTSSKDAAAQTSVFTGKGENVSEALVNAESKNPKKLYTSHLAVVVIQDKLAEEGIHQILDALLRNPESVKKYYVILARDNTALEVLSTLSPLESYPSQNIALNIRNSSSIEGTSVDLLLSEFLIKLVKPGVEAVLPSISVAGDTDEQDNQEDLKDVKPNAQLQLKSIGIFDQYKLLGWASEKESQGINLINGTVQTMTLTSHFEDDSYTVTYLSDIESSKKVTMKDGKPRIQITIKAQGALHETNWDENLNREEIIQKIQKQAEKDLKQIVHEGIDVLQNQYHSDVLGFGNLLYQSKPDYWKKVSKHWNEEGFSNIEVDVGIDITLKTKGSLETTVEEAKHGS